MKHAFSKSKPRTKFWHTCILYVCKYLLRKFIRKGLVYVVSDVVTADLLTVKKVVCVDTKDGKLLLVATHKKEVL